MTVQLLLFAAFVASMLFMSFNFSKRKKRVIFFGDSITEQGLRRGGYITRIKDLIRNDDAEEKYELNSSGIGGNKVTDLFARLEQDVLLNGPNIVIIFIGVNDIWHKQSNAGTNAQDFEKYYQKIITRLKEAGIKVILCTPTVIGEKTYDPNPHDEDLEHYASIVRSLASINQLPLADLRKGFLSYIAFNNYDNREFGILTTDGVHLNDKGNGIVAEEIWKVLRVIK